MRRLEILLFLGAFPVLVHSSLPWHERPEGYRYLMYSNPMYLKLSDGSQTKIQVVAYAATNQDKITLVIDDNIEDEGVVSFNDRRITLEYSESGLDLRARCIALRSEDTTFNHSCSIYTGKKKLGVLDVVNRIYPKRKMK